MERLISLLEEVTSAYIRNSPLQIQRHFVNSTMPERIKNILMEIARIYDKSTVLVDELLKFKENLILNNVEEIEIIINNQDVSQNFRSSMRDIYQLISDKEEQSASHMNDTMFYKDCIRKINASSGIQLQFINQYEHVSIQRRNDVIQLAEIISSIKLQVKEVERNEVQDLRQSQIIHQDKVKQREDRENQSLVQMAVMREEIQQLKTQSKAKDMQIESRMHQFNIYKNQMDQSINIMTQKHLNIIKELTKRHQLQTMENWHSLQQKIRLLDEANQKIRQNQLKSQQLSKQLQESSMKNNSSQPSINKDSIQQMLNEAAKAFASNLSKQMKLNSSIMMESSRASKSSFNKNSSIMIESTQFENYLQMNLIYSEQVIQDLIAVLPSYSSVNVAYSFPDEKSQSFHNRIKTKKNFLLVCLTAQGTVVGGFAAEGFSKKINQRNDHSFLFSAKDKAMACLMLKQSKKSTQVDSDFLIFGNEELWIERKSNRLHFKVMKPKQDDCFYSNSCNYGQSLKQTKEFLQLSGIEQQQAADEVFLVMTKYVIFELVP